MAMLGQLHLTGGRVIQYDESAQFDIRFDDGRFLKDVLEDLSAAYKEHGHEAKLTLMITVSDGKEGDKDARRRTGQ
jgi:hypothetical protein